MKKFADRLREARMSAGMTQEQLGFALGVTKSSISAWENGRETPSFRLLPTLRIVLNRSLDELLCGTSSEVRTDRETYALEKVLPRASSPSEKALLTRYRNLSPRRREALLELMKPDN
ncbi:MAG: helix-turn-helix domain-containing protein [Xanthomonadaceae bacterium]|jgi:transcriptional regulator with XRE-family HTH domain|nr:helix-turn-helix domain-containing protein [Xanthomonadaceae bacterium]